MCEWKFFFAYFNLINKNSFYLHSIKNVNLIEKMSIYHEENVRLF
jgi:hypothetical protein